MSVTYAGGNLVFFPVSVPLECLQMSGLLRVKSCNMSQSDESGVAPRSHPQVGAPVGIPAHLKQSTLCQQCFNIKQICQLHNYCCVTSHKTTFLQIDVTLKS